MGLGSYFHAKFPHEVISKNYNINILEILSIIICVKLWGFSFKGKRIQIFCDNYAVCTVINSGKSKCEILQTCLRELAFLSAIYECQLRAVYLDTKSNRIADVLSRWYNGEMYRKQFFELTNNFTLLEYTVSEELFQFLNKW